MEATSGISQITGALQTWASSMSSDAVSILTVVVPAALGVAGLFIVTKLGINYFKSLVKG